MKIPEIKRMNRNQQGFTMIEVLVGIAIIGILTIGVSAAIYQVIAGNARHNNHMEAVRQVQQVGHWVTMDGQMAMDIDTTDDPATSGFVEVLTLNWTEYVSWYYDPDTKTSYITERQHKVVYRLTSGVLERDHYYMDEDDTDYTLDRTIPIAQYLDSIVATYSGNKITVTVTANLDGFQPVSETREYEIIPRPYEI